MHVMEIRPFLRTGRVPWNWYKRGGSILPSPMFTETNSRAATMKFLILFALIAAAFAFPAEEQRSKRSAVFGAPGVVVSGGTSIIKGPSGVITADTGAIAAPAPAVYAAAPAVVAAAPAVVAAPYVGYGVAPAYGHGAVVVGPSAYGHPGYVKAGGHLFY